MNAANQAVKPGIVTPHPGVPQTLLRHRVRIDPDLPAADSFGRLIGAGAARRLIARFGGTRLYIPMSPHPDCALVLAIGMECARRLAQFFGGERVWLPTEGEWARPRILTMRRQGTSAARIARELQCTERYVFKVLAEVRDAR